MARQRKPRLARHDDHAVSKVLTSQKKEHEQHQRECQRGKDFKRGAGYPVRYSQNDDSAQNRTSPMQTNHDNQSQEVPRQDNQGTLSEKISAISDHDLLGFVNGLTARQLILRNN